MVTDLTKEHPNKTLWRFLLPMMLSVMFQQIYNIADSMIAGKFAGEGCSGSGWSVLSDHCDLYGICSGNESGNFGDCVQIVWGR